MLPRFNAELAEMVRRNHTGRLPVFAHCAGAKRRREAGYGDMKNV
jgi:hypothetical protein